jgi:DNA/RNA-binding domain of Phe-tRNA-synthetase-like protein
MEFTVSESWKETYPGAGVGLLAMRQVQNRDSAPLEARSHELEIELRRRYAGMDRAGLRATPILAAYHAYYRRFEKTYHVQLQLESVVLKGQPIRSEAPLVRAMLMAELDTLLLTAAHDSRALYAPIGIHVAKGDEKYTRLGGQEQTLKPGDMFIADGVAVLSSILYGPDERTRLGADTSEVLFTVYLPPGLPPERLEKHLAGLEDLVRAASPHAVREILRLEIAG